MLSLLGNFSSSINTTSYIINKIFFVKLSVFHVFCKLAFISYNIGDKVIFLGLLMTVYSGKLIRRYWKQDQQKTAENENRTQVTLNTLV